MVKRSLPPPRRYDSREIAERVNRERSRRAPPGEAAPLSVKELASRIGMSSDDWYKRTGKRQTPFTVQELARIAELLGAPRFWPFGEWDELEGRFGLPKA